MRPFGRVAPANYLALGLRAHHYLTDVPVHDVWRVFLPGADQACTVTEIRAVARVAMAERPPAAHVRALFALRRLLGRAFDWDRTPPDPDAWSFPHRISEADRQRSLVQPGTLDGPFTVLDAHSMEAVSEIRNATVHAFLVWADAGAAGPHAALRHPRAARERLDARLPGDDRSGSPLDPVSVAAALVPRCLVREAPLDARSGGARGQQPMRVTAAFALLAIATTSGSAQAPTTDPAAVRVITSDVVNFWRAYDRLAGARTREDSLRALTQEYFDRASPGLREFIRIRLERPENLLRALTLGPAYFAAVRTRSVALDEHVPVIRNGLAALQALYSAAVFPDIYFLVAGFVSQGTLTDSGLYIAAEMVSADTTTPLDELPPGLRIVDLTPAVIPCIVVHELVHHQQVYAPDRSLLSQALREGVADFLTMQAVGCRPTAAAVYRYGDQHETELWAEFRDAMHENDLGRWFYNATTSTDRPANLGYWMGYQIAEAYLARAPDKQQAVYDLLHVTDANALLARSGYNGGREDGS